MNCHLQAAGQPQLTVFAVLADQAGLKKKRNPQQAKAVRQIKPADNRRAKSIIFSIQDPVFCFGDPPSSPRKNIIDFGRELALTV